jgi:hypothetical protein
MSYSFKHLSSPSGSQDITENGTYDISTKASVVVNVPSKVEQTKTVDLSMASGNQVVSPDTNKVLSQVTITKPSTLIPENIKQGITIGGVLGTLASGGGWEDISSGVSFDSSGNLIIPNYGKTQNKTYIIYVNGSYDDDESEVDFELLGIMYKLDLHEGFYYEWWQCYN